MQSWIQKIKTVIAAFLLVVGVLSLTGCEQKHFWDMPAQTVLDQQDQQALLAVLTKAGVQVIRQGRVLQLVLPTDLFFEPQSTEVRDRYVYTLHEVALYLHNYVRDYNPQPVVRVSGYTDTVFSEMSRQNLSNQYAEVVASYLWKDGFSAKTLAVAGYGALYPIANNRTAKGAAYNRRVMIQVF